MSRAASAGALVLVALLAACEGVKLPQSMDGVMRLAQAGGNLMGAFSEVDEPKEVELGRAVTAGVGARYRLLRDEALTRYVALVGNAVAMHSDRPDLRYHFAVLDSDEVNAFAAPGGYVFITRGALSIMRDEAMLAGVLGHEVAHVALRHHVETIKKEKTTAALLSGAKEGLSLSQKRGEITQAFNLGADRVIEDLVLKGFSRKEEMESDAAGFKYASGAGYDAAGLRDFLKAMHERSRTEPATAKFFSTHPGIEDRLREQDTLLRTAAGSGRRHVARFERSVTRRGAPVATPATVTTATSTGTVTRPAALTPPGSVAPRGATGGQFIQSILASGRYVSHAIAFETGSDRLRPESRVALKDIADGLAATPTLRVRVEGHTDATGDAARNVALSQRRADAVRAALIGEFGVDASRLSTAGLGAARPIATNDTPEGRATNRRVEFVREPDGPRR